MFRIFTIALAILASSDVAFGRIGNNQLHVFASRPVDDSSNHHKAGNEREREHRALSESRHGGKLDEEVGNLLDVGKRSWSELWEEVKSGHHDFIDIPRAKDRVHDERHREDHDDHGHGRLRKLAVKERKLAKLEEEPHENAGWGMRMQIVG